MGKTRNRNETSVNASQFLGQLQTGVDNLAKAKGRKSESTYHVYVNQANVGTVTSPAGYGKIMDKMGRTLLPTGTKLFFSLDRGENTYRPEYKQGVKASVSDADITAALSSVV